MPVTENIIQFHISENTNIHVHLHVSVFARPTARCQNHNITVNTNICLGPHHGLVSSPRQALSGTVRHRQAQSGTVVAPGVG